MNRTFRASKTRLRPDHHPGQGRLAERRGNYHDGRALRRDHHRHGGWRGHAGAKSRAVGQAHPAAGAGRISAARAGELGQPRIFLPAGTCPASAGTTRMASRSSRISSISWGATRSSMVRSCSGSASGTSARSATMGESRLPGRSPTPTSSPIMRRRSGFPGARAGGRGPHGAAAIRAVPVPCDLARAPHPAALRRLRESRAPAVSPPVGVDLDESDPEAGRRVRYAGSTASPASADGKADAHVRCVRPALRHRNVTCSRTPGRTGW